MIRPIRIVNILIPNRKEVMKFLNLGKIFLKVSNVAYFLNLKKKKKKKKGKFHLLSRDIILIPLHRV